MRIVIAGLALALAAIVSTATAASDADVQVQRWSFEWPDGAPAATDDVTIKQPACVRVVDEPPVEGAHALRLDTRELPDGWHRLMETGAVFQPRALHDLSIQILPERFDPGSHLYLSLHEVESGKSLGTWSFSTPADRPVQRRVTFDLRATDQPARLIIGVINRGAVVIDDLRAESRPWADKPLELRFDESLRVYAPEQRIVIDAVPALPVNATWIVVDRVNGREMLRRSADDSGKLQITDALPCGVYDARLLANGRVHASAGFAVAPQTPTWNDDDPDRLYFGAHEPHLAQRSRFYGGGAYDQETIERTLATMRRMGAGIVRFDAGRHQLEPKPGTYNWEGLDFIANAAQRHGLEILLTMISTPAYAATPANYPTDEQLEPFWNGLKERLHQSWHERMVVPSDMEGYRDYVYATVQRYRDRIGQWEVWNEPDWWDFWLSSGSDYRRMLHAFAAAAHEADPSATVMNGGLVSGVRLGRTVDPQFQEKLLDECVDAIDAIAFHSYSTVPSELYDQGAASTTDGDDDSDRARRLVLTEAMRSRGLDTPLWMTEGSIYLWNEVELASELTKKMVIYKAAGIRNFTVFPFREPASSKSLVEMDWSPRAGFTAYAHLTARLGRTQPIDEAPTARENADGAWRWRFRNADGDEVWVVWRERGRGPVEAAYALPADAGAPRAFDLWGNGVEVETEDGRIVLQATHQPVYVVLDASAMRQP